MEGVISSRESLRVTIWGPCRSIICGKLSAIVDAKFLTWGEGCAAQSKEILGVLGHSIWAKRIDMGGRTGFRLLYRLLLAKRECNLRSYPKPNVILRRKSASNLEPSRAAKVVLD